MRVSQAGESGSQVRARNDRVASGIAYTPSFDTTAAIVLAFDFADWLQALVVIGLLATLTDISWLTYKVRRDSHAAV